MHSFHAEGCQGEVGGLHLPLPAPLTARSGGAQAATPQGGLVVGPVRLRRRTVMVLLDADEAVFCKPTADVSWTTLAFSPGAFTAIDVTYQKGAFHLVSHYGRVAAFDLVSSLR